MTKLILLTPRRSSDFGGIKPVNKGSTIDSEAEYLHSDYFLENREMGVIIAGGTGIIEIDGVEHTLNFEDGCYIPRGTKKCHL